MQLSNTVADVDFPVIEQDTFKVLQQVSVKKLVHSEGTFCSVLRRIDVYRYESAELLDCDEDQFVGNSKASFYFLVRLWGQNEGFHLKMST